MPENKDLAGKDLEDLTEEEATQLAYSRSTVSLDDYNPEELAPEDRVVEWDKKSYENSEALAEENPAASTATESFADLTAQERREEGSTSEKAAPVRSQKKTDEVKEPSEPAVTETRTRTTTKSNNTD